MKQIHKNDVILNKSIKKDIRIKKQMKKNNFEDEDFVKSFKDGNRDAFESLYNAMKGPIMSYAYNFLGKKEWAEEVLQEIFLNSYRRRDSFEPTGKITSWLWVIARNSCIDFYRKNIKKGFELKSLDEDSNEIENSPATQDNAEEIITSKAVAKDIQHCVAKMPDDYREPLVLRLFSELSYDEISQQLDESLGCVKTRIFRARKMLVNCLEKKGYQNGAG